MARSLSKGQAISLGVAAAALAALLLYQARRNEKATEPSEAKEKKKKKGKKMAGQDEPETGPAVGSPVAKEKGETGGSKATSTPSAPKASATANEKTPLHSNARSQETKDLHSRIEDIDRAGKAHFKAKRYAEAAEAFTEAIDIIDEAAATGDSELSAGMSKQAVTLRNNRSAMYEKGGLPDLALDDCDAILSRNPSHQKARNRRLRILEAEDRQAEALVEVCALQLNFMQENRDKLRMGIPVTPPVSQKKIEEIMGKLLPDEIERYVAKVNESGSERPLPSVHTILQLLQSFTGYSAWMAKAAKSGTVRSLTSNLKKFQGKNTDANAEKVVLLYKRGMRNAYDRNFEAAKDDFEAAMSLLEDEEGGGQALIDLLPDDVYPRLLEWVGMSRHLRYDLDGALKCYEKCSDLEPINSELLVKRAGVKMDGGKHDEAMELFESALGLDPEAVDALLHRANLHMLKGNSVEGKDDLNRLLTLRPGHLLARLRLATVLMATEDLDGAKRALELASEVDPDSSEVYSYRGEMHFAQGEFQEAREAFDKAIACEASNPTPYVNAALAVMNIPNPSGGPPDVAEAVRLLEKAIEVDPQFNAAYVHLGQLKLSMATDLSTASEVVALYDRGLQYCRTAEELKDIVSMRLLTVAQVDAAQSLKMTTLGMQ